MEKNQIEALDEQADVLMATLKPIPTVEAFLDLLEWRSVIDAATHQAITNKSSDFQKFIMLFGVLKTRGTAWTVLISFLKGQDFKPLAASLENSANRVLSANSNGTAAAIAPVHYATAKEKQQVVLKKHFVELAASVTPAILIPYLAVRQLLSDSERAIINANIVPADKMLSLFGVMAPKNEWWDTLIQFLQEHRIGMVSKLLEDYAKM